MIPGPKKAAVLDAPTKPVTTVASWPAPVQPATGDQGLLEEAFNLLADSRRWLLSRAELKGGAAAPLAGAIGPLRWGLHDSLLAFLQRMRGGNLERPSFLPQYVRETAVPDNEKKSAWPAEQARMMLQLLTDPARREPVADTWLSDPKSKQRGEVRFRRFERLDSVSDDLRKLARRAAVEAALQASFGSDSVTPLGGTKAIARPGREPNSTSKGGYVDLEIFGVGPSQKIREQFLTKPFKAAHWLPPGEPPVIRPTVANGPEFDLHLKIESKIAELLDEVLPPLGKLPVITEWLTDLRLLGLRYATAANAPMGAEVGLPLGAILAAVMRAYLVDLIAHTVVIAIPGERVRKDVDGYLAVALYEALSGKRAEHVNTTGYLATDANAPILKALAGWKVAPFADGWARTAKAHDDIAKALEALAPKPVLMERATSKTAKQPQSLDDWFASFTHYPVAKEPGLWRRTAKPSPDWYTAANFCAQCHLYVANWILRVAIDDLGLPTRVHDFDKEPGWLDLDKPDAKLADPPKPGPPPSPPTKALQLIAASSIWNNRKPPHKTHNDGASFDLRFGPNTPPWPYASFMEALNGYFLKRSALYTDPYTVNTHEAKKVGGKDVVVPVERGIVFEPLVKQPLVEAQLDRLIALSRNPAHPEDPNHAEWQAYDEVEAALQGTPHFLHRFSVQAINAGYVAILLSGPTQVIFSSPVSHARALRAIRTKLATLGPAAPSTREKHPLVEALHADFAWMPWNHWHHWHVHYNSPRDRYMEPAAGLARIARFKPLWESLGVDMAPFVAYLRGLTLAPASPASQSSRIIGERNQLATALDTAQYTPSSGGRALLHGLFRAFDKDSPLNDPLEGKPDSAQLSDAMKQSDAAWSKAVADQWSDANNAKHDLLDPVNSFIAAPRV